MKIGHKPGFTVRQSVPKPNASYAGNRQHDREIHAGFPSPFLNGFHVLEPQHPRPVTRARVWLLLTNCRFDFFCLSFNTRLNLFFPYIPTNQHNKGTNSNHHRSFDRRHDIHLSLSKARLSGPVLTGFSGPPRATDRFIHPPNHHSHEPATWF